MTSRLSHPLVKRTLKIDAVLSSLGRTVIARRQHPIRHNCGINVVVTGRLNG